MPLLSVIHPTFYEHQYNKYWDGIDDRIIFNIDREKYRCWQNMDGIEFGD
jgi:hypothetical protein